MPAILRRRACALASSRARVVARTVTGLVVTFVVVTARIVSAFVSSRVVSSRVSRPPPPRKPTAHARAVNGDSDDDDALERRRKEPTMTKKLEIGYWAIRGLGAPARMMCEHAGIDYSDVAFSDATTWFAGTKPELCETCAFANLPYVRDGDVVLSHSTAVYEYIGVKTGADAFGDETGRFYNAQALAETYDLRNALMKLVYPFNGTTTTKEAFETNAVAHMEKTLPTFLAKYEANLKTRKTKWLVRNDAPSSADFHFWEMLDQHEIIAKRLGMKSPLENFLELQRYYAEFRALPNLAKYFESAAYSSPMNSIGGGAWIY